MSTEHERKEAALRAEVTSMERDRDPRVAYLATWLVFYIDQLAETRRAWQESIDRITPKTFDTMTEDDARKPFRLTLPEDA